MPDFLHGHVVLMEVRMHMGQLQMVRSSLLWHLYLLHIDLAMAKDSLKTVVEEYKNEKESAGLGIESISGKRKIIRCLLEWVANTAYTPEKNSYLGIVKNHLEGAADIGGILDCLNDIKEWCDYRNEVIHSLLNKNIDSLNEELAEQVMKGMKLARYLDSQVASLKKRNVIRNKFKLPMK